MAGARVTHDTSSSRFRAFCGAFDVAVVNYIIKRLDTLKTKNARKIWRFRFFVVSLRKNSESMKPEHKHKSEESAARERMHQFGQPNGNPICSQSVAANQRSFYRWAETEATEDELKAYVQDTTKPYARRRFVAALVKCDTVQDFFDLTNQTHGQPKQVIEQTNLPSIEIVLE